MSDGPKPNVFVRALQTITPRAIRKRFALKFALVLLIMAASTVVVGYVGTGAIADQTQEDVKSEYRGVASQEADIIEQWVQRNELLTRLTSRSDDLGVDDQTALSAALNGELSNINQEDIEVLSIVEAQQGVPVVTASTDPSFEGTRGLRDTDRAWMAEEFSRGTSMTVGDVYIGETYSVDDKRYMAFVSPVSVAESRYLIIEVSISDVKDSLQGEERAAGGFTQVINTADDTVIIDEQGPETNASYSTDSAALEPVRLAEDNRENGSAGVIAKMEANPGIIDETYTVGYAPVQGTNWVVLTHAPRSSVFGFVQDLQTYGIGATIGVALLITIVGALLGYTTSSSIDRLTRKTEQMREGDLDVTVETTRIDTIGRLYNGFAEMRDSLKEQIEEAERARKEAEVSRAEAMEMSNYLQDKAEEYSRIMDECAAGDLTQRMDQDGENEAMDRIASEFNDMIEELEKTTGQLKSYVDEVEEAGSEVEQSANTVREASEQVADSIQKIAVDAEDQKERLQSISETIDEIASELEAFAEDHDVAIDDQLQQIHEMANEISEVADLSEETQSETDNVSAAAEEQAAELNEVSERANDLQRYAQPLRDILGRFDTEAEHEFVFSVGPTGSGTPSNEEEDD